MNSKVVADKRRPVLIHWAILSAALTLIASAGNASAQWATNGNDINNTNSGNVGIGTSSPGAKLDLQSSTQSSTRILLSGQEFYAAGNSSTSGIAIRLGVNRTGERQIWFADSTSAINTTNSQIRFRFFSNSASLDALTTDGTDVRPLVLQSITGNVGIGTSSPDSLAKLHIYGSGFFGQDIQTTTNDWTRLRWITPNRTWGFFLDGGNGGIGTGKFGLHDYNASAWRMVFDTAGNVGIGTTTPAKKLDVVGDINASGTITGGNISAKYQDLAEWVPASEQLPAGTVVVLDATKSNQVIASVRAYDTRVAGVISAQPGITLGERGDDKVLVATTGRVRVKVDASKGAIHIGDLLVTSDIPGMAMKSVPVDVSGVQMHRPGTLIGKALESCEKGSGTILVLLSLQ